MSSAQNMRVSVEDVLRALNSFRPAPDAQQQHAINAPASASLFIVSTEGGSLMPRVRHALIVWRGNAAYSFNPTTVELINMTEGVTPLTELSADDEIWVKY